MSVRALILGVAGALGIAGFGYLNNAVLQLNALELGYLLPVSVVGGLIVWMIGVHPLVMRTRPSWVLRPSELAVILLLTTCALSLPGRGLMERFTVMLATPIHWNRIRPGWSANHVLRYVPDAMIVASRDPESPVLERFLVGRGAGDTWIGFGDIPWSAWWRPLAVWVPLIILFALAMLCLSSIFHAQWAHRERLRYPIAEFIGMLLGRETSAGSGTVYGSRLFWVGMGTVLFVYLVNGVDTWFQTGIRIPLMFDFGPIGIRWPEYFNYPQAGYLLHPVLYPMVIGFAYFLASDVAFTLGVSQYLMAMVTIPLMAFGVPLSTDYMGVGTWGWERGGAYLAFTLVLLYTGRRYYWNVFRQAVTFRPCEQVEPYQAWACRIFLLSLVALTALLIGLGLDWTLSVLTVFLLLVLFLCVSRIAAETGLFLIHARWAPLGFLLGLLGGYALGPQGIVIVGMLSVILCFAPDVSLMPFCTNGLHLCERQGVRPSGAAWAVGLTYAPALALAILVVLWANYNFGVPKEGWVFQTVSPMTWDTLIREIAPLRLAGTLEESLQLSPIQRLLRMSPKPYFVAAALTGFGGVLVLAWLRLRYSWWPLHPVLLLVIATAPMSRFNHSFLLGCIIKAAVMRWGGQRVYQSWKPFMIGLIAGDLLGTLFIMVVGAGYYLVTGQKAPQYHAIGV